LWGYLRAEQQMFFRKYFLKYSIGQVAPLADAFFRYDIMEDPELVDIVYDGHQITVVAATASVECRGCQTVERRDHQ
jgi:hypothetical protein